MEYADVNNLAKRTLKDDKFYDRFFDRSTCKPTYLGKSDTAFTVKQMQKWAYKYKSQVKLLAMAAFRGKDLKDTVRQVYDFLHDHIQYQLDGTVQHLKSPACAWATREKGTDCKSYGIFASTLLQQLGIKHYFRRIKQPGLDPKKWTHVYVVVPKDQKTARLDGPSTYYIIDATVHDNKEVAFTEKEDTLMSKVSLPHYGLQSPARQDGRGLPCSRHGRRGMGAGDQKAGVVDFGTTPSFGGDYAITAPTINDQLPATTSIAPSTVPGKFGNILNTVLSYGTQAVNAYTNIKGQIDRQNQEKINAAAHNRQYGAPQYGTPGYGTPGYGTPGYGTPGYGTPGYGIPGYAPVAQQGHTPTNTGKKRISTTNVAIMAAAVVGGIYLYGKNKK